MFRQLVVASAISIFVLTAQAQVTKAMTPAQLKAEITRQLAANPNLDVTALVNAAKTAGVDMSSLAAALVTVPGINAAAAVSAVVKASPADAVAITRAAATAAPAQAAAIAQAAALVVPAQAANIAGAATSAPGTNPTAISDAVMAAFPPNSPERRAILNAVLNTVWGTDAYSANLAGVYAALSNTPKTCGGAGQSPC